MRKSLVFLGCAFALALGCNDDSPCDAAQVGTLGGCAEGQVCADVEGAEPTCLDTVVVRGRIFDALTGTGIAGASVVALDANGAARSTVAFSGPDGSYELPLAVGRAADGSPRGEAITLRSDAAGYQTFPTAPRTALPIEVGSAAQEAEGMPWVIMDVTTDVALVPDPNTAGAGEIRGTVVHPDPGGTLVVAEVGGSAVSTAIADSGGDFVLFNVPMGDVLLDGYRAGVNVEEQTVSVGAEALVDVLLNASSDGLSAVTGSVNIVNPGDCGDTSVILVLESTFNEVTERGEAPAGLRAGGVSGSWTIEDVPPGRYAVLAAFENDACVRDPDPCIAGTETVFIDVPTEVDLTESFKVTGALAVRSPGGSGIEVVTDAEPTFVWEDDSSEEGYELRVYDAFGELVHEDLDIPDGRGSDVTYTWSGASLTPGMIYQFRAWSWRRTERCLISSTEDLRGVFVYEGP